MCRVHKYKYNNNKNLNKIGQIQVQTKYHILDMEDIENTVYWRHKHKRRFIASAFVSASASGIAMFENTMQIKPLSIYENT